MKTVYEEGKGIPKSALLLATIGSGLVVANIYYNQPLLGEISRAFNVTESQSSNIAMITQIGYAMGLLFLIPLGDMFKRRPIVLIDFILLITSLFIFARSESFYLSMIVSFVIGFCSVIPQIFIPIVAQLSKPENKGKNLGIVMSGLLIGILSSRVISGFVGDYWGWRQMYYIATVMMIVLLLFIIRLLPDIKPSFKGTYKELMKSLFHYASTLSELRKASFRGALGFASFLAFWTTLTFHLEGAPFFAGSKEAGSLGLLGICGAITASITGRYIHVIGQQRFIIIGITSMFISWIIFGFFGFSYTGLIIGVICIDIGLQIIQLSSQTIIFSLNPSATNRINTIFMTTYFIGGSLGTFIGGKVWQYYGWTGVSITGATLIAILIIQQLIDRK